VFVTLGIQHAMRMRRIVKSSLVPLYDIFTHNLINDKIFCKKKIEHRMYVFIFSTTFVWNISHSKKNSVRYDHKCISVFM